MDSRSPWAGFSQTVSGNLLVFEGQLMLALGRRKNGREGKLDFACAHPHLLKQGEGRRSEMEWKPTPVLLQLQVGQNPLGITMLSSTSPDRNSAYRTRRAASSISEMGTLPA